MKCFTKNGKSGKRTVMFLILTVVVILHSSVIAQTLKSVKNKQFQTSMGFIENRGQITDQNYSPNPAVKFLFSMPGLNVQLKANGFSYDTYVEERQKKEKKQTEFSGIPDELDNVIIHFHRIDIEFIGANNHPQLIAEQPGNDYLNFYTAGTPDEGITHVNHYAKVTYKELYPGIDLEFKAQQGTNKPVEFNFIVHAGADLSQIKWKYNGSDNTELSGGDIHIKTVHGFLTERIPNSFVKETGETIDITYKYMAEGVYCFNGTNNHINTIIIDPIPNLAWATYYGGSLEETGMGVKTDASGNILIAGHTVSTASIATTGAYQTTYGGGTYDVVVAKFSATGTRTWGTYYGGTDYDILRDITINNIGDIFISGNTKSTTKISTTGAHQAAFGGGTYDAFIARFSNSGALVWGTYYGGASDDYPLGLTLDNTGNVIIAGETNSTANISTAGAFQVSCAGGYDGFLIKFTPNGVRLWGTYFGASGTYDIAYSVATDTTGNSYVIGYMNSTSGIATTGAYQITFRGGTYDVVLAKFDPSGARIWATYYGGTGTDYTMDICTDVSGNLYFTGYTASTTYIATTGAYQTTNAGGANDGYVAKFSSSGVPIWATYFGGSGDDYGRGVKVDAVGNVFLAGYTPSTSGIATAGTYQSVYGGGLNDAFLAKFNAAGILQWSTYFGGSLDDQAMNLDVDANKNIMVIGRTLSTSGIATSGTHQTTFGGGTYDMFIAKFQELIGQNNAGINRLTAPNSYLCAGNQDVKVEITNSGFNTINTLNIAWQINGVTQVPASITTPLLSGLSQVITLGNINFNLNSLKTIKIWTSLPNGVPDTVKANDTIVVQRKPGLNGTYTIGGLTPDYPNFASAVADLNTYGICGPVVFMVRSGTYTERISLNQIVGASGINTISFIGSGSKTTVLTSSGTSTTDMATVLLNGTDHVTFRDMKIKNTGATFGAGIWFAANADTNRFINLAIEVDTASTSATVNGIIGSGSTTAATTDGTTGSYNIFDSLYIKGGYHGIRINGPNTTTTYALQNTISHSTFIYQYQYGIYLRSQSFPVVSSNTFYPQRYIPGYSLYLDYSANIEVAKNTIMANDYGMYLNYVNRYLVNTGFTSKIYNNMFSSVAGYAMYSNQSYLLKMWHNSFSADPAVSVVRFVSCQTTDLVNNHILNRGTITARYALQADAIGTFSAFDYNNYFSTGSFVYIGTTDYGNLPVLQAAFTQFNQHSYNQSPLFFSSTDLHSSINLTGIYVGIDNDIDGDLRNLIAPVLGADEVNIPNNAGVSRLLSPLPAFCAGPQPVKVQIGNYGINSIDSIKVYWQVNGVLQPVTKINIAIPLRGFFDVNLGTISFVVGESKVLKIWTAMPNGLKDSLPKNDTLLVTVRTGLNGTYTIGGTNPDFANFNQAVSALNLLGVCSPVVFNVRPGTYSEKVIMGQIKGTSIFNTVTFKGSGKSNTNLSYSGTSNTDWATLLLKGTDFVTFRDMTISSMGTTYGIGILLSAQADSNSFINLTIQSSTTSTSVNIAGIAVMSSITDFYATPAQPGSGNLFDSLEVNGGYYGLYLGGNSFNQTISHSIYTDQLNTGISCYNQNYFLINRNTITSLRTGYFAALNISFSSNLEVSANTINIGGDNGIYLQTANGLDYDTNFHSRIFNNMVSNTIGYSIYSENSSALRICHNSFRSVGNLVATFAAAYIKNCNAIDLRNNHIRNDNPNSYALYAEIGTFDSLDFNNYYSFGNFVYIGTPYANLTALKNALTQFNRNSYSQNPFYIALTNLHTSAFINGVYVGIDQDIDGEPRCPATVSVGADDKNWGFAKPVISTNHTHYLINYPIRFSNNVATVPGITFKWYVNGNYINDSASFQYTFSSAGPYKVSLQAERCIYRDSAQFNIQIAPLKKLIALQGADPDSMRVFDAYTEPGYVAKDIFNNVITSSVVSWNNIDTALLGTYTVWYTVKDPWGNKDSSTRKVVVIDDVSPMMSLIGPDTIRIEVFGNFLDPGAIVTDNYWKNIVIVVDSSKVNTKVVGVYKLTYTSTDGSGNTRSISRWIKVVDTGLPVITLIGGDTILWDVFVQYVEAGAKVTDNYCKTGLQWQVDTFPPTNVLANYTLTYTASDCQGNQAVPVTRVVKVVDRQKPVIELNGLPNVTLYRWETYSEEGVSISDNYYKEDTLQKLLKTTGNVNMLQAGVYSVCYQVTDPSNNKSVKQCRSIFVLESTSSINNMFKNQVRLYPNPNNGRFTIYMDEKPTEPATVSVLDISGKEVYKTRLYEQETIIQTDALETAVYFIKISYKGETAQFKAFIVR
jgi:hypothetical protein